VGRKGRDAVPRTRMCDRRFVEFGRRSSRAEVLVAARKG
jgi:hypothetical protein